MDKEKTSQTDTKSKSQESPLENDENEKFSNIEVEEKKTVEESKPIPENSESQDNKKQKYDEKPQTELKCEEEPQTEPIIIERKNKEDIVFKTLKNDGTHENMKHLIDLKNIFAK